MDIAEVLKELTEARGPSGYETEVRELVAERLSAFSDEIRIDAMGNLIALKRGEGHASGDERRPSVMLAAHMDEIALMVSFIEKGFIRISPIGGFDPRILLGQAVTVHGRRELPGLIVSVPPHFTEAAEREKPVPPDKLFVDIGLPPSDVDSLVKVGDVITLRARYTALAGGFAFSKSLDDRAGITAVLFCMEELGRRRHSWDVYAVATVQEEVTGVGAVTGAFHLEPTVAVAVDVTFGQQPGVAGPEAAKMDGGAHHLPRPQHTSPRVRPPRRGGQVRRASLPARAHSRKLGNRCLGNPGEQVGDPHGACRHPGEEYAHGG